MRSVMSHNFSTLPSVQTARSRFNRSSGYKTTFDAGYLIPFFCDEGLPGDTFACRTTMMIRINKMLTPVMDNLFLDTFYFAVPNRLLWDNWEDFITGGDHVIPVQNGQNIANETLQDYFGIPTQITNNSIEYNALPFRAYNLIYNEWFRPQDLINEVVVDTDDGDDDIADYSLLKSAKRHDYFTSCLPWPQKGDAVEMSLGDSAPVIGDGYGLRIQDGTTSGYMTQQAGGLSAYFSVDQAPGTTPSGSVFSATGNVIGIDDTGTPMNTGLMADLSSATGATINSLREAIQLQRMLETDARGGTRYTENIRAHFGVISPDSRMQRPEYLGGSSQRVNVQSVVQTSQSDTTPQGTLAGYSVTVDGAGKWVKSFTEHVTIIGICRLRADLTYQQGLNRMWSRQTRYDYYWPKLAHLGEQEVLNKELYCTGDSTDDDVFGYQERYAEYRYKPSMITGKMRSNDANSLDVWHLSQDFASLPTLGQTFIEEDPPLDRVLAAPSEPHANLDAYIDLECTRPMPVYSVPGFIDHF